VIQGLSLARDVVADRGFFARTIIDLIEAGGAAAHIPSQTNVRVRRLVDPAIYRRRNLVARLFNNLKHFRRIATRFDKLARNYLAAVLLAATCHWTRAYESITFCSAVSYYCHVTVEWRRNRAGATRRCRANAPRQCWLGAKGSL
jgi:transposase